MSIFPVTPVFEPRVRRVCTRPYYNHHKGCPNFGRKEGCPPLAPLLDQVFDMEAQFYVVINKFPLGEHVYRMMVKHPGWTYRQASCCLYWQGTARKQLKNLITYFQEQYPEYQFETCPEAMGLNVTQTLTDAGLTIEWPPGAFALQVALAGKPLKREEDGYQKEKD